jgi:hypothetical protein
MGWACNSVGRTERCTQNFGMKPPVWQPFEKPCQRWDDVKMDFK